MGNGKERWYRRGKVQAILYGLILVLIPCLCFGQSFRQINDHSFKAEFGKWREVYIGDSTYNYFVPKARISRWADECWMSLEYPTKLKRPPTVQGGRVTWSNPDKIEIQMFTLPESLYENGGFEYLIILKEKPANNQIVLDMESNGVRFAYQPALSQEEIDQDSYRPDSVVGSYAVYHATRHPMHRSNSGDATKYQACKVGHIYRPKVYDADGAWIWANLEIANGKMVITIPLDWIENGVYPITVDPTFGYTTAGQTEYGSGNYLKTYPYACSESGTADSLTAYAWRNSSLAHNACFICYDATNRIDYSTQITGTGDGVAAWRSLATVLGGSLSSGLYYLGWYADSGTRIKLYYDADTYTYWDQYIGSYAYPPPSTWTKTDGGFDYQWSIYCTYSTGAPPEVDKPRQNILEGGIVR